MSSQASAPANIPCPFIRQLPEKHEYVFSTSSHMSASAKHPLRRQFPGKHHITQLSLQRNQKFPLQPSKSVPSEGANGERNFLDPYQVQATDSSFHIWSLDIAYRHLDLRALRLSAMRGTQKATASCLWL